MFLHHPLISFPALLGAGAFLAASGFESRGTPRLLVLLFLLITVTNPFFSHNGATVWFYINGNAVTAEALFCGGGTALMIVSVLLWCRALSEVITGDKIVYLAGKTVPQTAVVLAAAMRYIPLLRRQAAAIGQAQKAMGIYTSDSYTDRVKASLRIFSALVGWSLEHAVETGKSMKARGGGAKRPTSYSLYRFSARDVPVLAVTLLLTAVVLAAAFSGSFDFSYYPIFRLSAFTPMAVFGYLAFAGLAFLPAVLEVTERVQWHYYKSKI